MGEHTIPASARRSWAAFGVVVLFVVALAGCATPERLPPVPSADVTRAMPLGLPNARFFPIQQNAALMAEWELSLKRQRQSLGLGPNAQLPPVSLLAISGGGDNGAFGCGVLVGWGETGTRPRFQLVTGVSTGSLIAPFAFLGDDAKLRTLYTTVSAADIYEERGLLGIFDDALSDTTPLWNMISRHVDENMMAAIAREYRKGRLLFIGTTDLDSQRPNIWNIGAIADSGHPGALDLFRKVLRASSAVPAAFQPVMIDVELDGKAYQELHVDGGAIAQIFLYPVNVDIRSKGHRDRRAYLILNARQDPEWADVERQTISIAGRAISTMIHSSGTNDIMRIYFITQRDKVDYNLAYIGSDFSAPRAGDFDTAYMQALYNYGYEKARRGYPWQKVPPVLDSARR